MKDITPEGIKKEIEKGVEEGRTVKYMEAVPLNELIDGLEEYVKDPKVGLLSEEERAFKKHVLGGTVDWLGDEIYQLPGGGLTGKTGWKMFEDALKERGFGFPDFSKK